MNHLSNEELQEYVDTFQPEATDPDRERHIRECTYCSSRAEKLMKLERSLRKISLDQPSSNFTGDVLERLRIGESTSITWKIVQNLAPLFALVTVIGIALFSLNSFGTFHEPQVQQTVNGTQEFYRYVREGVSGTILNFNQMVKEYLPFVFVKNTFWLAVYLLVLLAGIATVDRFILMPRFKRKVSQ